MELADFWNSISKSRRHIVGSMNLVKQRNLIRRLNQYVIKDLKKYNISSVLDWGCGGGLLAKELIKYFDVSIFDIAEKSLIECINYVGRDNLNNIYLSPDNIKQVDAIHCSNVIHHFPSFKYWYSIVDFWKKMEPICIVITTKLGLDAENKDYFKDDNYLSGLFLSKITVVNSFHPYKLVNFNTEATTNKKATIAFYTFLRD